MKKFLLVVILMGFMSTNTYAVDATVNEIIQFKTGLTAVILDITGGNTTSPLPLNGDLDTQKRMLSILLTAQSLGATVGVSACTDLGVFGWCTISIK